MNSLRAFLDDQAHNYPAHERPAAIDSPASPSHKARTRSAHMAVGVLVGVTAGLGGALVSADLVQVRQVLGLSPTQAAWLSTSYVAAVPANLVPIKVRQQYGLRRFALVALGIYAAAALARAWVTDVAAMLLRAIGGFISVTLIPLCLFHTMQAFPTKWRLRELMLGIGITQCAVPLARLLSPSLLDVDGWRSLFLLGTGLTLLSLAAVGVLRLPPRRANTRVRAAGSPDARPPWRRSGRDRCHIGPRAFARLASRQMDCRDGACRSPSAAGGRRHGAAPRDAADRSALADTRRRLALCWSGIPHPAGAGRTGDGAGCNARGGRTSARI
ncbi:MFS transporter [Sphingomonas zeicaulis]|uniref:MFS transporter n=1 Tax=Sphingomonas zeicaulis TaxID=1632740 RepID=UPI003D1B097F